MNFGKSSEDPASPVLVQAWPPASVGPGHSCSWPRLPSSGCRSLAAWSPGQASCKFYDSTTKGDLDRTGRSAVGSWMPWVVGLTAQEPSPIPGVWGGATGFSLPDSLVLWNLGAQHCSPLLPASLSLCWLFACPRRTPEPGAPGLGRFWSRVCSGLVRRPGGQRPAPSPSPALGSCPFSRATVTEADGAFSKQTGHVTTPLGTKVSVPLSV